MVRIGESRDRIESAIRLEPQGTRRTRIRDRRIVVLYEYGTNGEHAREAAAATVPCLPSIGGRIWCEVQKSIYAEVAESSAANYQQSLLQVIYDANEVAEWVVFGSTTTELSRANDMINGAERGDARSALSVGRSLSRGTNGFPYDIRHAYQWLSVAVIRGSAKAPSERDRVGLRLGPEEREEISERVEREWSESTTP